MSYLRRTRLPAFAGVAALALAGVATAAPIVSRLTPPSELFSFGDPNPPIIARFLPGQRFDLQATVRPDAGQTISQVEFLVDGTVVTGRVTLAAATVTGLPAGTQIATLRAYRCLRLESTSFRSGLFRAMDSSRSPKEILRSLG